MAYARELPIPSELAVAASVLVVEDDPANRVVRTRLPARTLRIDALPTVRATTVP